MSRTRRTRALVLLAACALCSTWILRNGFRPSQPTTDRATPRAQESPTDVAPEIEELAALTTSAQRTVTISPAAPVTRGIESPASPTEDPWVLRGSVVDDRGRPVAGALVGITALQRGAPASSGERSRVLADTRGSFEFPVPVWARGGSHLLCARSEGWQPDSRVTTFDLALARQTLRMTLRAGNTLSGVVLADGEPVPGASVSFDAAFGTPGVFGMGREAWWVEGRLFEKHGSTTTDAQGRFEVHGMGPYGHWLRIHPPQRDVLTMGHFTFLDVKPGDRVFDVTRATLSITVDGPGDSTEVPGVEVLMDSGRVWAAATPEPLLFHVPPDLQVKLTVSHPHAVPAHQTFEHLAVNRTEHVHVSLEWVERPSLTLHLPGATDAGVNTFDLRLAPVGSQQVTELWAIPGPGPDTFHVAVVPCAPGRVELCLGPRGKQKARGHIKPQVQVISLPEAGDVLVELALEFQGRCVLDVESPLSSAWSATASLTSPAGASVRTKQYSMEPCTEWGMMASEEMEFGFGGIERANLDALHLYSAGTYTYRIESPEHRMWSQQVTINAGETARVTATLVPL